MPHPFFCYWNFWLAYKYKGGGAIFYIIIKLSMFWFLTWVVSVKPLIAKSFLHIFTFISSRINIHLGHLPLITIKSLIIFTFYYSRVDLYFHLLKVPLYFSLKNFAQFMNFLKIIHYLVEIYSIYFEVHHTMLSISHRGFTCLIITCWINSLNIYLSFFVIDLVIGPTKLLINYLV